MASDDVFPESVLRIAAGAALVVAAVGAKFGTMALFAIGVGFMATFGCGMLVCLAALLGLWICLGKKRLGDAIDKIDRTSAFILPLIYLAVSVACGVYFSKFL